MASKTSKVTGVKATTKKVARGNGGLPAPARATPESRTDRILLLLLAGKSVREIAAEIGVNRITIWRVKNKPEFRQRFEQARNEALDGAVSSLHHSATVFANTLREICSDPKNRDSARGSAARDGLAALWKARELYDHEDRLRKLEQAASEWGNE